ncbi:MAG: protein kinase [Myxococcales bacterium]|nr:protein kinase [Myxococcales bacterium]
MATEHDPLLGTVFAERYRIERRLGAGGMGCVYAATQLSMSREVALKVLNPELSDSDSAVKRFVREMKASTKVEHPNTIRVYDFGKSDEGRLFLAMELLPGQTLHQALRTAGALPTARLLRIAEQIARALSAAHAEGIVHRDLKPENVMLIDKYGERDQVRVLDFGIARFAEGGVDNSEPALTRTGTLIGTPLYMSPEQALGKPVDHRSDLYSLGVLLYQMATGVVPFTAETPIRVLFMHANDMPKPPSAIASGRLPKRLETLILKLLEKSPDQRYADATAVIDALRKVTEGNTLHEADDMLRASSRLADPDAMRRARAAHQDPGGQLPTVGDVTVAAGDVALMQTADALAPAPVANISNADTSAATMGADDQLSALESMETGVLAQAVLDTSAGTVEAPAPDATLGEQPKTAAAAAAAAEPDAQQHATTAQVAPPASAAPGDAPTTASVASSTQAAAPAAAAPASDSGGGTVKIVAAALIVAMGAVGWAMSGGDGQDKPKKAPETQAAVVTATAKAADPEAAKSDAAAMSALGEKRGKLAKALAANGTPVAPASCQTKDPGAVDALIAAVTSLHGGRPRGKRPADEAAVKTLAALTSAQRKNPEVQGLYARAQLLAGKSDPAIVELAKSARAACPSLSVAWTVEGTVHLLSMRAKVASGLLSKAVALSPEFQRARYNLGLAQLGLADAVAALASFEEVRRREPKRPGVMIGIGQAHLLAKRFPQAIGALIEATTRAPTNTSALYLLGTAHKRAGDAAAAQKAWCAAAKLGHPRAGRKCPDAAGIPVPK